jgi:hypothetical protein
MHVVLLVLLIVATYIGKHSMHGCANDAENAYQVALSPDAGDARAFQLARFTVLKAQAATHRLGAELTLIATIIFGILFANAIGAEVRSFVSGL